MLGQFIFGDLNYRLAGLEPSKALELIAQSGSWEKNHRNQPLPELEWGPDIEAGDITWVRERYLRLFEYGEEDCSQTMVGLQHWTSIADDATGLSMDKLPASLTEEGDAGGQASEQQLSDDDDDDDDDEDEDVLSKAENGGSHNTESKEVDAATDRSLYGGVPGQSLQVTQGKTATASTKSASGWVSSMWNNISNALPSFPSVTHRHYTHGSVNSSSLSLHSTDGRGPYSTGSVERMKLRMSPWGWVLHHDELLREMKEGRVFAGFSEGVISFPPSFRWKPGGVAGDFDKVCCYDLEYSIR